MKSYTYTHPEAIEYTGDVPVLAENGQVVAYSRRVYDNFLKRTFDKTLDFRYFLKYDVLDHNRQQLFTVKKISRRGKLWFEGVEAATKEKYLISYENWRIGIPTLYITNGEMKIVLEKEFEDWSRFLIDQEEIAKWKAEYREGAAVGKANGEFHISLQINDNSPIQQPEFFIAICQATLFVGA
ncbi:hypothetical protein QMK38_08365 [Lysinibacillus fusiformis]|nr:hypothetical protein [Lysinibacillus fusiformis]